MVKYVPCPLKIFYFPPNPRTLMGLIRLKYINYCVNTPIKHEIPKPSPISHFHNCKL